MQAWELKLKVRRHAVEGKLFDYWRRHGELAEERSYSPYKGPSWHKKSEKMAILRGWVRRELAELEFIKMMANAGPIVGNRMVLHVRDGMTRKVRPGPSIIDIIQREIAEHRQTAEETSDDFAVSTEHEIMARGLDKALSILYNPYKYLNADEKAAYDEAEELEEKIINARASREPDRQTILPGKQPGPSLAAIRKAAGSEPTIIRRRSE